MGRPRKERPTCDNGHGSIKESLFSAQCKTCGKEFDYLVHLKEKQTEAYEVLSTKRSEGQKLDDCWLENGYVQALGDLIEDVLAQIGEWNGSSSQRTAKRKINR